MSAFHSRFRGRVHRVAGQHRFLLELLLAVAAVPRARAEGAPLPRGQAAPVGGEPRPGHAQTLEEVDKSQLQRGEQGTGAAAVALNLHHGRGAVVAGPGPRPQGPPMPRGAHQTRHPAEDCPALGHTRRLRRPDDPECQEGPV